MLPETPHSASVERGVRLLSQRLEAILGRKRLLGWGGALSALLVAVAWFPWAGENVDRWGIDLVLRLATGWRSPHPDLVIVGIDTETLAAVPKRWPWPRGQFARLLSAVASTGPKLIVFDFLLQQPEASDGGAGDRELAATLHRLGNVHLISLIEQKGIMGNLQRRHFRSDPAFRRAAAGEGFVWAWVDADGLVRSFVLRDGLLGKDSCVLKLAPLFGPDPIRVPDPDEGGLSRSLIAFAGGGGETPTLSALDFLKGRIPPRSLGGRVVVLGGTAPILHDYHRTCRGLLAGTRLLTATLDTLLQHRLTTLHQGRLWRLLMVGVGFLLGGWATLRWLARPWLALSVGLTLAALGWAILLVPGQACLPLFPLLGGFLSAGVGVIALNNLMELLSWQALQAEAAAAGLVQRQLFPSPSWKEGEFVSFGCCQPCSAAGGDYFDVVQLAKQDILFLVNDVAGHGIGAAMVASMLKSAIASLQNREMFTLEAAINQLNDLIFRLFHGRKMVTGVFCRLEVERRRLTLISAGHVVSLIVRRQGRIDEVGLPGLPLGVRAFTRLKMVPIRLEPGDTLVLYTDGVIETTNGQKQPLGYPAWKALLAAQAPLVPNARVVDRLLDEVRSHSQGFEPTDDVTLLLLHRQETNIAPIGSNPTGSPEEKTEV